MIRLLQIGAALALGIPLAQKVGEMWDHINAALAVLP